MGVYSVQMKTHKRSNLNPEMHLNECLKHGGKPECMDIVAGRHREHFYVVSCKNCSDCSTISTQGIVFAIDAWNKNNKI